MKVFLSPIGLYSPAMDRIAAALTRYKPTSTEIVSSESACDISIMYVIGFDYVDRAYNLLFQGKHYVAVQCCVESTNYTSQDEWKEFWSKSLLVWSYLDIKPGNFALYLSPLGVDEAFSSGIYDHYGKQNLVLTSGHVSGESSEAIEEVWQAAHQCGLQVIHTGASNVSGLSKGFVNGYVGFPGYVADERLAQYYATAKYVSGLRHKEGFELPAAEGLACGARPILFDRPCYRQWYRNRAIYVPECHGSELVNHLVKVFSHNPEPVTASCKMEVRRIFNWRAICEGFWTTLMKEYENVR